MSPAGPPDVSVIIPTRNRWELLSRTLASVFAQQGVELEVVVVDDGSADETSRGVTALGRPNLTLLRNERSLGQAKARNRGIDAARGHWIAFLDDDDLWAPSKLRRQLDAARAAGAAFAYSSAVVVDGDLRPLELYRAPSPADLRELLIRGNAVPAGASNVIARAGLVRQIGGFDERLSQLTDWDLWIRLASSSSGASCEEVLLAYLYHPGNLVLRATSEVWGELRHVADKHADLAREWGARFDRADLAYWIGQRQASAGYRFRAVRTYLQGALAARRPHHARLVLRTLLAGERKPQSAAGVSAPEWLDAYRAREPAAPEGQGDRAR